MNQFKLLLGLPAVILIAACSQTEQAEVNEEPAVQEDAPAVVATNCPKADESGSIEIQKGLTATITKKGYGRAAKGKDYADVHTTLWLYDEAAEGGRGQVIWGWDLGVNCMLLGEKRELKIAPELGYGERGKPPVPPNATLLFEIELVKLTAPEPAT